jgi:hypothetical protein
MSNYRIVDDGGKSGTLQFVVQDLGASPSIIAKFRYRNDAELFVMADVRHPTAERLTLSGNVREIPLREEDRDAEETE